MNCSSVRESMLARIGSKLTRMGTLRRAIGMGTLRRAIGLAEMLASINVLSLLNSNTYG